MPRPTARPQPPPGPLVEGPDYTVEGGRWVFTANYLRRRGYCCGSGCRHCPYGERGVDEGSEIVPEGTADPRNSL